MRAGLPGCAGHAMRVSPMSWTGVSSKHTTGRRRSGTSPYRSSTSSIRATYSLSTQGMHHILHCQGLSACSAKRRRTVSRDRSSCSVRCTISPANNSSVQRARPGGGSEHATATSNVSSRPLSLRLAPSRGASLNTVSRHPSTNRRLMRYTVEVPTSTVAAIAASLWPCSAANRICARLTRCTRACPLRVGQLLQLRAFFIAKLRRCSVCSFVPPSLCVVETVNHGGLRVDLPRHTTRYSERQGQYLAFIHAYAKVNGRPPAQADIQRFCAVTAPSVHQMTLSLERRGLLPRTPGRPRSLEVLVSPEDLPVLR